jgi:hypothetical protein
MEVFLAEGCFGRCFHFRRRFSLIPKKGGECFIRLVSIDSFRIGCRGFLEFINDFPSWITRFEEVSFLFYCWFGVAGVFVEDLRMSHVLYLGTCWFNLQRLLSLLIEFIGEKQRCSWGIFMLLNLFMGLVSCEGKCWWKILQFTFRWKLWGIVGGGVGNDKTGCNW